MRQSRLFEVPVAVMLAALASTSMAQSSGADAAPASREIQAESAAAANPMPDRGQAAPRTDDSSVAASETVRLAAKAVLLDSVRVDESIIAVGERGTIVRGAGEVWNQIANVPTRATLTAAFAVDDNVWAVGHDGVILHSADGGVSWERQRVDAWEAESANPQSGVPLLDVLFLDAEHGFAVGAYSLLLETRDGGATWEARSILGGAAVVEDAVDEAEVAAATPASEEAGEGDNASWNFSADELDLDEESDPHFNAIARTGSGALLIASERGTAFRSRDQGATWQKLKLPYAGSMFGAIGFNNEHVLLFGLRGNVLETFNLGDSWHKVDSGV
ncbi:MAG: YCF48-related protein, partial [Lysobacterales bacterium]